MRAASPGEPKGQAPRAWRPRLEGVVVLERDPREVLDAVAEHAEAYGYDVTSAHHEEHALAATAYRVADAEPSLHLVAARPRKVAVADQLRLWRIDDRSLGYEMTIGKGMLPGAWVFAFALGALLGAVLFPRVPSWLGSVWVYLATYWLLKYALLGRRLRSRLRAMLDAEAHRVQERAAVPPQAAQPTPAAPPRVVAEDRPAPAVRIAPQEPALAATVRTARDAFVRHTERSPEDEVQALERAARRRGE